MAAEPPVSWASPPATQGPSQRAIFAGLLTFVAIVGLSWGVVGLIGQAWTTCADIEAGGGFALTVLWLPGTIAAASTLAFIAAHRSRRRGPLTRSVLVVVAIVVALLAIIVFSVPYKGYADWPGGAGDEASAECGPGGIPTWWPAWLPN